MLAHDDAADAKTFKVLPIRKRVGSDADFDIRFDLASVLDDLTSLGPAGGRDDQQPSGSKSGMAEDARSCGIAENGGDTLTAESVNHHSIKFDHGVGDAMLGQRLANGLPNAPVPDHHNVIM